MKILLIPNNKKEHTAEVLQKTLEVIESYNTEFEIIDLSDETQVDTVNTKGDIILYIGGDGTFIRSSRLAYRLGIPIVGINTGKVGYLSKIAPENIEEKLDLLIKGEYEIIKTEALSLKFDDKIIEPIINDAVFASTKLVSKFTVEQNGESIFECCASAVSVCDSIGSTGLNKSAGGAVITPGAPVFAVTPVCPQNGDKNCVVCPSDAQYTVTCDDAMRVSVDGQEVFTVSDKVNISAAARCLKVVR